MLSELKMLLGIADNSQDDKLKLIISTATARLKVLLGGLEPPESLEYIIREVSVIRFNKIGSEGMKSQTVEGESMTFDENDFSGFMDEIQAFLDTQNGIKRGRVRFL